MEARIQTRTKLINSYSQAHIAMLSMIEEKYFSQASQYKHWLKAMNEELDQIKKYQT